MIKNIHALKFITLCSILLCLLSVTSCTSQGVTSLEQDNVLTENTDPDTVDITSEPDKNKSLRVDITMEGGSGKAFIESPVTVNVIDGKFTAVFVWNSKNYDYMIVDGIKYDNENPGGESTFTIPVKNLDDPLTVIGDTVAMSTPHEIEYVIYWNSEAQTEEVSYKGIAEHTGQFVIGDMLGDISQTGEVELKYATGFKIRKFDDYRVIAIEGSGEYLVVPQGEDIPDGVPESVVILTKPLDRTYLVSTSVMDFVSCLDCLYNVRLSGTKEADWYIDSAKSAMNRGDILYAGKYRAPDYELILSEGCDLAIENTMIYHNPEVKEKLEELGIPVLVETSSYEEHPLGRLEWIKLYGTLFDKEDEAAAYYDEQLKKIEPVMQKADTGKTVAFFHVTTGDLINVRKSGDYISRMIELSGGKYVIKGQDDSDNALSTMNMQMEDFYAAACNADIIIYNSTISGEIGSINELIAKNELFKDFKAVKDGQVYCTGKEMFQQTTGMADFMQDLNNVFTGNETDYTYLTRLE